MRVRMGTDDLELIEPHDVRRLDVVTDTWTEPDRIDAALRRAGLGAMDDSGLAAWLDIASLRTAATGRSDGCSAEDFDAMIDYARSAGWVEGDRVRAHLERGLH